MLTTSDLDSELAARVTGRIKLSGKMSPNRVTLTTVIVTTCLMAAFTVALVAIKAHSSGVPAEGLDWFGATMMGFVFGPMAGLVVTSSLEEQRRIAIRDADIAIWSLGMGEQPPHITSGPAVTTAILRLVELGDTTDVTSKLLNFTSMRGVAYSVCSAVIDTDALARWNTTPSELRVMLDAYDDADIQMLYQLLKDSNPWHTVLEPSPDEQDADFHNLVSAIEHHQNLTAIPGSMDVLRTLVRDSAPSGREQVLEMIDTSMLVLI